MPIRSAANPPVDWGDTETLSGFMRHLTRSQYKTMESGSAQGIITKFLFTKSFLSSLTGQVTIFVAWIGIFGLWWLYRRDRKLFIFTALIFLINSLGLIAVFQFDYIPLKIFKLEVYYFLPAYLIYIVWIGCGLAYFAQKIAKAGMLRKACTLLAVFLPLIPLVSNYRMNDWSDNYIAYDYGQNILKSMEKDSVIFGLGDTPLFVLWYLYFVEHERQDITIVHLFPSRAECEALEGRNPSIVSARNLYGAKFMRDVVETNYGRVPLYIHLYDATWLRDTGYTLLLEGLVFRIVKSDAPEMSMEPLKAHWNLWRNYTYANTHRTSLYKGYVNYMVREIIQVYAGSYHSLGGIYLASYMDLEKAKAEFEKALEFAPDFADASLWLGKTYYLMQDYPSALLYLRRYLSLKEWKDEKQKEQFENKIRLVTLQEEGKLSPEKVIFSASDESLIDRAVACFQEGKYDEALSRFEEILKSNPEEAWRVYNNIGLIYYKEGKYERALVSYGKAIELNPDYDSAYYNRGLLYQRLKKFKEAIADYEKAIGINRTYFNAYVKSGDVYRELGENEKALRNWKKAEQIDPQNDSLKQKIYGLKSMK